MYSQRELCQICDKENYKYVCPKCNILYCSVACYRDKTHLRCSEEFYMQWIKDEQKLNPDSKFKESLPNLNLETEEIDSDDEFEEEEEDLAERMKDVNLDDWKAVWDKLTAEEKAQFWEGCESGKVIEAMPMFKPWWEINNAKVVDIAAAAKEESKMPEIIKLNFGKKKFAPQLPYNMLNVIGAYALIYRLYRGDFSVDYYEAASMLINLSCVLKENATYENTDEALNSVTMEAATLPKNVLFVFNYLENLKLVSDAKILSQSQTFQMAALSDVLRLIETAKSIYNKANEKKKAGLRAHCMSIQVRTLDAKELRKIIKKFEFFLGYATSLQT